MKTSGHAPYNTHGFLSSQRPSRIEGSDSIIQSVNLGFENAAISLSSHGKVQHSADLERDVHKMKELPLVFKLQ